MSKSIKLLNLVAWMVSLVPAFAPFTGFSQSIRVILLKHKSFHITPLLEFSRRLHITLKSKKPKFSQFPLGSYCVAPITSLTSSPTTLPLLAPILEHGLIILQTGQAYAHLWPLRFPLSACKVLLSDTWTAHSLSFFKSLCYYSTFSMRPSLTTHKAAGQHS